MDTIKLVYTQLEAFDLVDEYTEAYKNKIKQLEKENKKLKEAGRLYREDNKKLRAENEYLHKLLPEADGYIIEKQLEQRLWNDGEEDVYEY